MRVVGWRLPGLLLAALALAGCRNEPPSTVVDASGEPLEALPVPAGSDRGGVTGMPDEPGPGPVGPPMHDPALDAAIEGLPSDIPLDDDGSAEPGLDPVDAGTAAQLPPADGPTPADALAVVRDYYAALNAGDFARAYALWSDGGRASGRSPQQFAAAFDNTAHLRAELLEPGRIDAAAGSIEVPVALTSTDRDGVRHRYVGVYLLRHTVDGATPEQRAWRIASADIREVQF